jgi:hypothetical protein
VDSDIALELDRSHAGYGAQRRKAAGIGRAGEDAHAGQGRIRPEPEGAAGDSYFFESLQGIVGNGDRDADPEHAHGA